MIANQVVDGRNKSGHDDNKGHTGHDDELLLNPAGSRPKIAPIRH
jgi:hypothetical protein